MKNSEEKREGQYRPAVALVRCGSYDREEVEEAVRKAFELLGGLKELTGLSPESRLVMKPNLLSRSAPERACTTHPAVFRAVGRLLKEEGFENLTYGDSPGTPVVKPERVAEECGIKEAADSLKIPFGKFDSGSQVEFPKGRTAKSFILCDEITDCDGIINICKMKTHQLERITGAMKNIFGCVFGINKGASHAKYPTAESFGRMIADLNSLLKPRLHIMDGILAMEGNGPQSGTPKKMGLILVSKDPVALDGLFCRLVDLRPELVPTNVSGKEQGVGTYENIEVVTEEGSISADEAARLYGDRSFSVERSAEYRGALKPVRFLAPFLEKRPVVKKEKCIGCGLCVRVCPVEGKAVKVENGRAEYDYGKCIKCYCCQEMCPEEAIAVRKSLLARIADRKWRM